MAYSCAIQIIPSGIINIADMKSVLIGWYGLAWAVIYCYGVGHLLIVCNSICICHWLGLEMVWQ